MKVSTLCFGLKPQKNLEILLVSHFLIGLRDGITRNASYIYIYNGIEKGVNQPLSFLKTTFNRNM
jgi:hypothetical protein